MRLTDILIAFPYILLALAIVAGLGRGLRNAIIAIAVGFPIYTHLVRGIVLSVRGREFVEAARPLGSTDRLILVRHIVPQLISTMVVAFSLDVGAKILAAAGLSFLGLGAEARRLETAVGRVIAVERNLPCFEEDLHDAPGGLAIPELGKLAGGPLPVGGAAPGRVDRVGVDADDPVGPAAHRDRALRVFAQGEARPSPSRGNIQAWPARSTWR